jgi:hypothetical protein
MKVLGLKLPRDVLHSARERLQRVSACTLEAHSDGELALMDLDLSEDAFEPRDPWRVCLQTAGATTGIESVDFSSECRVSRPFTRFLSILTSL